MSKQPVRVKSPFADDLLFSRVGELDTDRLYITRRGKHAIPGYKARVQRSYFINLLFFQNKDFTGKAACWRRLYGEVL